MLPRPGMKNSTNEMKQANNGLLKRKIDAPLPHGTLFIYLLKEMITRFSLLCVDK